MTVSHRNVVNQNSIAIPVIDWSGYRDSCDAAEGQCGEPSRLTFLGNSNDGHAIDYAVYFNNNQPITYACIFCVESVDQFRQPQLLTAYTAIDRFVSMTEA